MQTVITSTASRAFHPPKTMSDCATYHWKSPLFECWVIADSLVNARIKLRVAFHASYKQRQEIHRQSSEREDQRQKTVFESAVIENHDGESIDAAFDDFVAGLLYIVPKTNIVGDGTYQFSWSWLAHQSFTKQALNSVLRTLPEIVVH